MLCYTLKIILEDETTIIRTVKVTDNFTLRQLAEIIGISFNWEMQHEYYFKIEDVEYLDDSNLIGVFKGRKIQSTDTKLSELNMGMGRKFNFYYDMACYWSHNIEVINIEDVNDKTVHIIEMIGDYLPEDTGSTKDLMDLLEKFKEDKYTLFNYKKQNKDVLNKKLSQFALM